MLRQAACAREGSEAFPGAADVWEVRGQAEEVAGDLQVPYRPGLELSADI